jgi:hypothetical protein
MSRASTELKLMQDQFVQAVPFLTAEDMRAMLLEMLPTADPYTMRKMAEASSYKEFDDMVFELNLVR